MDWPKGLRVVAEQKHVMDLLEGKVKDGDRIASLSCVHILSLQFLLSLLLYC
jgi:hypothetical protein